MIEKTKQAYKEIFEVLRKHKDIHIFDINDLQYKSKIHLFGIKLKEEYELDINPRRIQSLDYFRFSEFISIGWYGEKYRRTISWSDDGSQPDDELLLSIRFSTGAHIFGEDYPQELFQKLFLELKSYKPKYTDTVNAVLFFSMNNAKDVFNSFDSIMNKYYQINKDEKKQRKMEKLKKELEKLEGEEK